MAAQPKHDPPHGMEPYDLGGTGDLGALSTEQQEKLNKFKIKTRMENEKYLRAHPEVNSLLTGFLREVFIHRPENVREFAAEHFTDPNLPLKLQKQLEERHQLMKQNNILKNI